MASTVSQYPKTFLTHIGGSKMHLKRYDPEQPAEKFVAHVVHQISG